MASLSRGSALINYGLQACFTEVREQHVSDDCDDDDGAAEEGPARWFFTEDEKDPDGIQDRFDVTNNPSVQRPHAARHSQREECVSNAELNYAEVCDADEVMSGDAGERCEAPGRGHQNSQGVSVDHG